MTTRKTTEKNIRKLTRVGTNSLSETIPIEYIPTTKRQKMGKDLMELFISA